MTITKTNVRSHPQSERLKRPGETFDMNTARVAGVIQKLCQRNGDVYAHLRISTRGQVDEYITPPATRDTHALQIHLLALLVTKNGALLAGEYNQARLRHSTSNTPAAAEDTPVVAGEIAYLGLLRCPVVPDTVVATAHLKRRLSALLSKNLPPILSDPEELWECGYCPVRDACEQLHAGPVGRDQIGDGEA